MPECFQGVATIFDFVAVDVLCPAPFQSDFFFCLVCLDQLMPCFECAVVTYRRVDQSSNHPNITFSTLDWFDALSLPLGENAVTTFLSKAGAGIVIGADIVFDPILVPPLVATLRLALSFESTRMVVMALTVRNEQTLAYFVSEAVKELRVEEVPHAFTSATYFDLDTAGVDAGLDVKIFKCTLPNSAS
ncbi:hypothetical protein EV424DRAFT_1642962 [Suillus variegatus]|nr:hypothetical protein EV424DRAFT_1642962 [Suillus variegatus]